MNALNALFNRLKMIVGLIVSPIAPVAVAAPVTAVAMVVVTPAAAEAQQSPCEPGYKAAEKPGVITCTKVDTVNTGGNKTINKAEADANAKATLINNSTYRGGAATNVPGAMFPFYMNGGGTATGSSRSCKSSFAVGASAGHVLGIYGGASIAISGSDKTALTVPVRVFLTFPADSQRTMLDAMPAGKREKALCDINNEIAVMAAEKAQADAVAASNATTVQVTTIQENGLNRRTELNTASQNRGDALSAGAQIVVEAIGKTNDTKTISGYGNRGLMLLGLDTLATPVIIPAAVTPVTTAKPVSKPAAHSTGNVKAKPPVKKEEGCTINVFVEGPRPTISTIFGVAPTQASTDTVFAKAAKKAIADADCHCCKGSGPK